LILFNSSEVPEFLERYAPHITYKHTVETNKKEYTNHLKQYKKQQKTILLVETITWT
jgi:hypothetical protein